MSYYITTNNEMNTDHDTRCTILDALSLILKYDYYHFNVPYGTLSTNHRKEAQYCCDTFEVYIVIQDKNKLWSTTVVKAKW